ncbi:hypothetical protein QTP88_011704 [Uroleucon formosanum]
MSDFNNINQLVNQISEAVKHFSCFTNVCDSTLNLELELRFIKWKRLITEDERITHDFDQIQNIIKSIGVDNEIVPLKVIRLGRYQISPSRISISSDRTLHQRDSMRKLREELAARSSNGETGLTIKFIKGVPRIVKNAEVSNSKPQNFLIST